MAEQFQARFKRGQGSFQKESYRDGKNQGTTSSKGIKHKLLSLCSIASMATDTD
jgi:hypothetical protein